MNVLEFIQKYFILLLPGIIGMLLYNKTIVYKEQHYYLEFTKIIMCSFFSFLLSDGVFYVIQLLFPCFIFSPIHIIEYIGSTANSIPSANVFASIVVAVVLACVLTKADYNNWIFIIANKLNLTHRTDNESVWDHFFDDAPVVTMRDLVTGNTYYGRVKSYSDNSSDREICFEDVKVFDKYSEFLYYAKNLYLSRAHNEFTIEVPSDKEVNNENDKQQS